ncbi:MAG TPA: cyclase family protein, partial [Candidatus Tectomicrobia bacterium]
MMYSTHLSEAVYRGDFQPWALYYTMAYPMRIYDVSVPLSPTLVCYPGDPPVEVTPVAQLAQGDVVNVSRVTLSSHSGTHLDAPRHFFAHGTAVDALDLEILLGPARICLMT